MHRRFDWLRRLQCTSAPPPDGRPLRRGAIYVEDVGRGRRVRGAVAFALICRNVPGYWPLLALLAVPPLRRRVAAELDDDGQESCQCRAHESHPSF